MKSREPYYYTVVRAYGLDLSLKHNSPGQVLKKKTQFTPRLKQPICEHALLTWIEATNR